jgi:integrase
MKLTEANVAKIKRKAGTTGDLIEWDDALPGFGLRVRDGRATWIVQYKIDKQHRRLTLGTTEMLTADEARKGWTTKEGELRSGARKILVDAHHGFDAATEKANRRKEASNTLDGLIRAYLDAQKAKQRPRTYLGTEYQLNGLWKPLHGLAVATVSRATVAAQVNAIAKTSGPVAANRARATLSALFAWAIGEGLCDSNPVVGTNKQTENPPRERTLSDAEAATVWLAAPENDYGRITQLILLTGCRRTELGDLQWSEIDEDAKTITLPAGRTKNKQQHVVPLCDAALAILKAIPRRDRLHVFGMGKGGYSGWSKAKTALQDAAKLKTPWTLHDLRRTVRTGLGMLGVAPHIAEATLNHLPAKLIRTYDRNNYAAEKKAALDLWASHLAVAVAQASGANVTRLTSAS